MSTAPETRKRRAHVKSRGGCLECKRRHHKCDEVHPICGSCQRLDDDCHYVVVRPRARLRANAAASPEPANARGATSVAASADGNDGTPLTQPWNAHTPVSGISLASTESAVRQPIFALDLELMANVFMGGLVDVFPSHGTSSTLLHEFVKLAIATPYLLHEVLAMSALRLFAENTARQELILRASYHQAEALRLVQPHVEAVTQDQSLPLLFFSSFVAISGIAEAALDAHGVCDGTFDPIAKTTHSFQLSRGTMALVTPHWQYIRQTWAWSIISSQIEAGSDLTAQPRRIRTYIAVRSLAFGVEPDTARKACLRAVDLTFDSLSLVSQREDAAVSTRRVSAWPIEVGDDFHLLLAERRPVSLVILAHYAALLRLGTGLWWVGRWPELLLDHIVSTLGDEWEEFLAWPKTVVFDGTVVPVGSS